MAITTAVTILIDQRGNSNKIWAQVLGISDSKGKSPVIHGPNRKNGAGLVENTSSVNWRDKEKKGYQMLVTFEGVPHGMERTCVAGIAHVKAGEHPRLFNAGSQQEIEFARKCGEKFLTKGNWGGRGFTVDLSKDQDEPDIVAEEDTEKEKPTPKHDLTNLLKTTRRSSFF